jgi:hypothetical protein
MPKIMSADELASYTAVYRRTAFVIPVVLLALALFMALVVWAITSGADAYTVLFVVFGGAGATILVAITAVITAFRVHRWRIESAGLRIEERPKVMLTGFARNAFAPWAEIIALRRIQSGFDWQIEIEMRGGAVHRMAQGMVAGADGRRYIADHTGLSMLATAISTRLAAAGLANPQIQEGLSFWNRLLGLAILCLMFVASVVIAGAAATAFWNGTYLYGAVLKGGALVLVLPMGAGYLVFKSVKRRLRVLAASTSVRHI